MGYYWKGKYKKNQRNDTKKWKRLWKDIIFHASSIAKRIALFQQRVNGNPENKSISIVLRKKYFLANELLRREIENIHIKDNERE